MPRGLAVPMTVDSTGGIKQVDSDDNDDKIVRLALGAGDNENAFQQDITLGEGMIFDISDETLRGSILNKIKRIFAVFESQKRFRLLEETITWSVDSDTQETILAFKYLNLETDEPREFEDRVAINQ